MTIEQLIIKAIDKCAENADEEQKRVYCWMKAALKYPDIEKFIAEIKSATQGFGKVSIETMHNACEFAASYNEWLIRNMSIADKEKEEKITSEKIRLKEVEVRMSGVLQYFGLLKGPSVKNRNQ